MYLVCVMFGIQSAMCRIWSVLCAGFSLCYVQSLVGDMPRFAWVARFARFRVQLEYMTELWDLPRN